MFVSETIESMTKLYLDRVVTSFSRDIHKFDEKEARSFISKNIKDLTQENHILTKLDMNDIQYRDRMLMKSLIIYLLIQPNYEASEKDFYNNFNIYVKDLLKRYKDKNILNKIKHTDRDLISALYRTIISDNKFTTEEEQLLLTAKKEIGITDVELYSIMNSVQNLDSLFNFSNSQIENTLKNLQVKGLVFYVNKDVTQKKFVIPTEIALIITKEYDYPLDNKSFSLLLNDVPAEPLRKFLKSENMSYSGSKDQIVDLLWHQGFSARKILESLSKNELNQFAKNIKTISPSESKNAEVNDALRYFFTLNTAPLLKHDKKDEAEYWEYYEYFANRNYNDLHELGLIKKDVEIESYFEKLTRYAFQKLCGLKLVKFEGLNNPDGGAFEDKGSDLLLWDNKSQESPYTLPLNHQKQFLQYLVKSKKPVKCFLVITGLVENVESVEKACIKLSDEATRGTGRNVNIGVISAKTFKAFIDDYSNRTTKQLDTQIFNYNGVITDKILETRMLVLK